MYTYRRSIALLSLTLVLGQGSLSRAAIEELPSPPVRESVVNEPDQRATPSELPLKMPAEKPDDTLAALTIELAEGPDGSNNWKLQPRWHRMIWLYAVYFAGFAAFVFSYLKLRVRNRELIALTELQTRELKRTKEFLANISHEISNPMNGVMGIAEAMKFRVLDPDSQRKWRMLHQCSGHLASLLEDIRDFSRGQSVPDKLESKPFDLPELLASVVAITAVESETYGIPVEVALSPFTPPRLIGDERRTRQILVNFVTNAIKYSGRGKVSIAVWRNQTAGEFAQIFFAVADEGPGIAPGEQEKIFARFFRSTKALLGQVPGSGLGLSLCRSFANEMSGEIWLKSTPGQGSCFYFSAPFVIPVNQSESEINQHETTAQSPKLALVVDDEEYNRIALTCLLERHKISALAAANGCEALALAQKHVFDFVFLDYALPDMTGPEIARAFRSLPDQSTAVTILATTGSLEPEQKVQWVDAGIDAFLHKPVSAEQLRQSLVTSSTGNLPARTSYSAPTDPLANLRQLATKKRVPLAKELTLYFDELEVEMDQLAKAIQIEDSVKSAYYAHLLYGRFSFIRERHLEELLRHVANITAVDEWAKARVTHQDVVIQTAALRVRLFSDRQVVQSA